jgi:hypothetical protein
VDAARFLAISLQRDVGIGGNFDYQREGSLLFGFTQLRHYRNVSNFNVGVYMQQGGFSLDETLRLAGTYARFRSGNWSPSDPYGLDIRTRQFIEIGFRAGQNGAFNRVP